MIEAVSQDMNSSRAPGKMFLDEAGQPSDMAGPDLTQARPIEAVIKEMAHLRNGFSVAFRAACRSSGIDLSVMRTKDGEDRLMVGCPMDDQEHLRQPRFEALRAMLARSQRRRSHVIDLMNLLGHFADNQPYSSVQEAAGFFLAAGGRIYILPDGRCEEVLPYKETSGLAESWQGYPMRRLVQRYGATLRQKGARAQMAELVRKRGKERLGSIVWERENA